MLGLRFKRIEIIQSVLSNSNETKLENHNNRRKFEKFTNIQKLNNTLLNNQWIYLAGQLDWEMLIL